MSKSMLILVVEDSTIAQLVIKAEMAKQGCTVDIASNGYLAIEKACNQAYDLILVDIGLGDGPDGFDVTAKIKVGKLNRKTPIFAVTSHTEDEYQEKASSYGMDGYFNKPLTAKDVKIILDYVDENYPNPSQTKT